jgi:hypothetical protein
MIHGQQNIIFTQEYVTSHALRCTSNNPLYSKSPLNTCYHLSVILQKPICCELIIKFYTFMGRETSYPRSQKPIPTPQHARRKSSLSLPLYSFKIHFNIIHVIYYRSVSWSVTLRFFNKKTVFLNLMFCWPCIVIYQWSKTNKMHFLFNLLRINSLYMLRPLLTHLQEATHKQQLVYWERVMSVGCYESWQQLADVTHMQYTNCCLCSAFWRWAVVFETFRGCWFIIHFIQKVHLVVVEMTNNMHWLLPLLCSIHWLLHVSAVACHHQGAS